MNSTQFSSDERVTTLSQCLDQYLKRGFQITRQSNRTAELYKPARFPGWFFREERRFLDVDEQGRIHVQKR